MAAAEMPQHDVNANEIRKVELSGKMENRVFCVVYRVYRGA